MDRCCFFVCVLLSMQYTPSIAGIAFATHKSCCSLGRSTANTASNCDTFLSPIGNISKADQPECQRIAQFCCQNEFRTVECNSGIHLAKSERTCETEAGSRNLRGPKQECCEACKWGRQEATSSGASCDMSGLEPPYEATFRSCCEEMYQQQKTTTSANVFTTIPYSSLATSSKRSSSTRFVDNNYSQPKFDVCDIENVCAQICIPMGNSHQCACEKGYILMNDTVSCKPDNNIDPHLQSSSPTATVGNSPVSGDAPATGTDSKTDRCAVNNPCEQICVDTGISVQCSCNSGYELGRNRRTCIDIDECAQNLHKCSESTECVNEDGSYYCEGDDFDPLEDDSYPADCAQGYKFNSETKHCDDIDECELNVTCLRPKICTNTPGSYICGDDHSVTPNQTCPPGFYYKSATESCEDMDECVTGQDDCNRESQHCLNTKGNFTCVDKASKTTCPPGFKMNTNKTVCEDIDECVESVHLCAANEDCINEDGGHTCTLKTTEQAPHPQILSNTPIATNIYPPATKTISAGVLPRPTVNSGCNKGFSYSLEHQRCVDIDECRSERNICDQYQVCYNTIGSYMCDCRPGFTRDYRTGACTDINECQIGTHDCGDGQRCDNSIGSYMCARTSGCGTGYTLNYESGDCEDDNECTLGTHTCGLLGTAFQCRNTLGSYRCERVPPQGAILPPSYHHFAPRNTSTTYRTPLSLATSSATTKITTTTAATAATTTIPSYHRSPTVLVGQRKHCLPGYAMNVRGMCEDVNECDSNPCRRQQKCINLNGRYECVASIRCPRNYEPNEDGTDCVDINECTRGTHTCNSNQICRNGPGYHRCDCPPGYIIHGTECRDVDECKFSHNSLCPINADCTNTIGSFQCNCRSGFRDQHRICADINECVELPGVCQQNCINLWGSYRCSCQTGFTLGADNKTCADTDECVEFKDKHLCVGTCVNVPGTYTCKCPQGYRIGFDGRTCQDIDECLMNPCSQMDDVCVNTRGSYKCQHITCPDLYTKAPNRKSRCVRGQLCDVRDFACLEKPEVITHHFIAFVSRLPLIGGSKIEFFQMKGPSWQDTYSRFNFSVDEVRCTVGTISCADSSYFRMIPSAQRAMLQVVKPIDGPQEIDLTLEMRMYNEGRLRGTAISKIVIFVSEYVF